MVQGHGSVLWEKVSSKKLLIDQKNQQAIVITNTCWIGENVPCLIYGLRGLIEVEGKKLFFIIIIYLLFCVLTYTQLKFLVVAATCITALREEWSMNHTQNSLRCLQS